MMKKINTLIVSLLAFVSAGFAQNTNPESVIGRWQNEAKDVKIEVFKSGNKFFGKLLWAKTMFKPDGKTPKKDDKILI